MSIGLPLEIPDEVLDVLADRLAVRLRDELGAGRSTPWMDKDEAIAYTRMKKGTFEKWVQEGRIPVHGGRHQLFHVAELDRALGYAPAPTSPGLRRVPDAA
ncbi:MAG TPA: hypothetical protein VF712_10790 [Thermoleophilaceae bacterium]